MSDIFTTTEPTEPGWYWVRRISDGKTGLVELCPPTEKCKELHIWDCFSIPASELDYLAWSARIPSPEELAAASAALARESAKVHQQQREIMELRTELERMRNAD